mgnify:FL=1|tara:strand:+ start:199 stop:735 length:537 start_codon:yes stop_codon:yes gene_type:complete
MPFQFRKEAIEEDLNSNFPSQGQGNPPLYYSLSEVVVPTYSINDVTDGTSLPESLQQAWDFSTGANQVINTNTDIITNPGFWLLQGAITTSDSSASVENGDIRIIDSTPTTKVIFRNATDGNNTDAENRNNFSFIVFLRSGDKVNVLSSYNRVVVDIAYRQIADVNGNLVNPLGFSFA